MIVASQAFAQFFRTTSIVPLFNIGDFLGGGLLTAYR